LFKIRYCPNGIWGRPGNVELEHEFLGFPGWSHGIS
jgi:hypothetical protein